MSVLVQALNSTALAPAARTATKGEKTFMLGRLDWADSREMDGCCLKMDAECEKGQCRVFILQRMPI